MAKKYKIKTLGFVPAAVGTHIIVFEQHFGEHAMHAALFGEPVYTRHEMPVVLWRVCGNNLGHNDTWAVPVTTLPWERDENYVIVHADGRMEFHTPYSAFEGDTLDEFEDHTDDEYRTALVGHRCLDCDTFCMMGNNSPVLKDEVWQSIVPGGAGRLCREHMEQRLGRKLEPSDLIDCIANNSVRFEV